MHSLTQRALIASLSLLLAAPTTARSDILGFGNLSAFSENYSDGDARMDIPALGSVQVTYSSGGEVRSLIDTTQQPIGHFVADFIYQTTSNVNPATNGGFGLTFVLENRGPDVVASNNEGIHTQFGYTDWTGAISPSVAVSLEFSSLSSGSSATGVYQDAGVGGGASPSPLSFFSGDPIQVQVVYDGSLLQSTFTDLTTHQSFVTPFTPLDIPSIVGSANAYVGFTMNTNGADEGMTLSNFHYQTPEPSTLLLATLGAIGLGIILLRRRAQGRIMAKSAIANRGHQN